MGRLVYQRYSWGSNHGQQLQQLGFMDVYGNSDYSEWCDYVNGAYTST